MSSSERSGAVLAGVAVCLMSALRLFAPPQLLAQVGSCERYEVTPPISIKDPRGRPVYLEMSHAVRVDSSIVLFSNVTLLWRSEKVFADTAGMIDEARAGTYIDSDTLAGVIIDPRGGIRTFGKPPGVRRMVGLVAASDARDGVWAAWLSTPDTTKEPNDLWVGHFRDGRWDSVELVWRATSVSRHSLAVSPPLGHSSPIISLTGMSGLGAKDPKGVAVFRIVDGKWTPSWVKTGWFFPVSAQVRRLSHRELIAAYGGSQWGSDRRDTSEVWVATSSDDGATWTPFRSIARRWNRRTNWLQIESFDAKHVGVVWMDDVPSDSTVWLIHMSSDDGGSSWHEASRTEHRRLKSITTFPTSAGLAVITRDVLDSLALVELRNHEAPALQRIAWQGGTLPARATALDERSNMAFVVWGSLIEHAYPMYPALRVPASSYGWIRPCKR